ncbi:MAG: nucleotidyltransferase domain-containing protein [Burkholderiales bacterium]|nr:nucleotidyltransferase domain-containing protein [Burkholderiales bacterium]
MAFYTELSLTAQTAYAQLLDAALASEHLRTVADLSGSFAPKTVKGHKYWYYQYTEPSGRLRQIFVGPESEAVKALMEKKSAASSGTALVALARSAISLGCAEVLSRQLRVIRRLSEYGFFRAGGVLIGTHAFLAFGNMLGVVWGDASRTQDIDFAHAGKNLAVALPADIEVHTHEAIQSLEMGFLPISGLSSKAGATYLNPREPDFRLDFLTTLHREGEKPYEHPQLHVTLQPLKFMEFSLENVQQTVLFSADGAVVVNVPHPARYALHKLLVYGERSGGFAVKSNKDIVQTACLLSLLKERRPWEVEEAWQDLTERGKGWITRVKQGVQAVDKAFPSMELRDWLKLPCQN